MNTDELKTLIERRKELGKQAQQLKKEQREHDRIVADLMARGGSALFPEEGRALFMRELAHDNACLRIKNERQDINRAIRRLRCGYESRFNDAWKSQAGVLQRAEDYGHLIRFAGPDKEVYVAPTVNVIRTEPYIGMHALITHGPGDHQVVSHRCITFDIDGDLSIEKWHEVTRGLPPAFIVGREIEPGVFHRPHAIINMLYPVKVSPSSGAEWKWKRALEEVMNVIAARLIASGIPCDADIKVVTKNPDYDGWDCYVGDLKKWTLPEIKEAIGIFEKPEGIDFSDATSENIVSFAVAKRIVQQHKKQQKKEQKKLSAQREGRNTRIFNALRLAAYEYCSDEPHSFIDMLGYCNEMAEELNVGEGLKSSELAGIAKSVAKFCANKVFRKSKDRGAAFELMAGVTSKREAQSRGASYTHMKRAISHFEKVQEAKKQAGDSATIKGIAKLLGIDRNTVRKYWSEDALEENKAVVRAGKLRSFNVVPFKTAGAEPKAAGGVRMVPSENGEAELATQAETCEADVIQFSEAELNAHAQMLDELIGPNSPCKHTRYLYAHYHAVAVSAGDIADDATVLPEVYVDAVLSDLHELGLRSG